MIIKEDELLLMVEGLSALLVAGLGKRGMFALKTALEAAHIDGVGGTLTLKIPHLAKRTPSERKEREREFYEAGFATE